MVLKKTGCMEATETWSLLLHKLRLDLELDNYNMKVCMV